MTITASEQLRYDELVLRRKANQLTSDEREELLQLIEQIEVADAERVERLVALANLRGVTLRQLMTDLGIKSQPYT